MIKKLSYIESNTTNPYFNLALEEELFNQCDEDEIILYLWKNRNTVVIGKNQNAWRECNVTKMEKDEVTLVRRMSGGGAVFHDTGNLNFTFICHKKNYDVRRQLRVIIEALETFGIEAEISGRNDMLAEGRKFSGNAFYQRGERCYHHGTLMVDVDTDKLERYLSVSKKKMESKGIKSVRSRVINLAGLEPSISIDSMKTQLRRSFEHVYEREAKIIFPAQQNICMITGLMDKYSSWEWNYGRKVSFQHELSNKFSWGELVLQFNVLGGVIHELDVFCDSMDVRMADDLKQRLQGVKYDIRDMCRRLKSGTKELQKSFYGTKTSDMLNDTVDWLYALEL